MTEKVRPFSNGSEYSAWTAANCEKCAKGWREDREATCEIEIALLVAYFDDGMIDASIRERMGTPMWDCGEFEAG